jgi:hypothetical protein
LERAGRPTKRRVPGHRPAGAHCQAAPSKLLSASSRAGDRASSAFPRPARGVPKVPAHSSHFLRSRRDAILVALAVVHGAVLAAFPTAIVVGVGLWWCANTVSHNFIHGPFFRARWMNRVFSAYLSLLLGVPQTVWRDRPPRPPRRAPVAFPMERSTGSRDGTPRGALVAQPPRGCEATPPRVTSPVWRSASPSAGSTATLSTLAARSATTAPCTTSSSLMTAFTWSTTGGRASTGRSSPDTSNRARSGAGGPPSFAGSSA